MRKVGITIAIPTYNRAAELQRTLLGLRELRTGPDETFEIIVIGNNCTDNTSAMVARNVPTFGGRLRYVEEQRQGLNHARNRAIADAQYDVVAFLDDDVDIDPAWIMGVARCIREVEACGDDWAALGGRALLAYPGYRPRWLSDGAEGLLSKNDCGLMRRTATPDEVFGLNMILRREWVRRVGGFRPDVDRIGNRLISGGDTDLVQRMADTGGKLFYEPLALVGHRVAPERLRRRWFLSRCYWGGWGNTRLLRPDEVSWRALLRSAWHLALALRCAVTTGISSGPRSSRTFEKSNLVAMRLGTLIGVLGRVVATRRHKGKTASRSSVTSQML